MYSCVIFDLDGTISDPKVGICTCVQYALQSFGIEEPDLDKLEPFIGPPLRDSFREFYGFDAGQAEAAVQKYRERFFVTGKFENVLYLGMGELLRDLWAAGVRLAVASSKPTVLVEEILRYFGIRQFFTVVVGSELDGTRDKKEEVTAEVCRQLAQLGLADRSGMVMVGDRKFDMEGARAIGVYSIGAGYGYAAAGELEAAGADIIVKDVESLRCVLFGGRQNVQPGQMPGVGRPDAVPSYAQAVGPQNAVPPYVQAVGPQNAVPSYIQTVGPQNVMQPIGQPADSPNGAQAFGQQLQPPPYYGSQPGGVFSGYGARYRTPKPESKGKKIAKAIGIGLLAMATYYVVAGAVATGVLMVAMFWFDAAYTDSAYYFWLNAANAAGIVGAFAACFGIWHKGIRIRFTKPVHALSLAPMMILAASLAMGMNGLLNLVKLYELSPAFQEVSEIQGDIPVWLGVLSYGILAPLGEETVFRGVVYGQLKKISNVWVAVFASGVAFGLFHGNLVQAVYASVLGIVLALVYELYGSIIFPMLFHGIANLFVYLLIDLTDIGGIYLMPVSCLFFLTISAVSLLLTFKWQGSGKAYKS